MRLKRQSSIASRAVPPARYICSLVTLIRNFDRGGFDLSVPSTKSTTVSAATPMTTSAATDAFERLPALLADSDSGTPAIGKDRIRTSALRDR